MMVRQNTLPIFALRFIWAALLLGQLVFAMITMVLIWPSHHFTPNPFVAQKLTIVAVAAMVILLPLAFVIRRIIYHRGPEGKIAPARYLIGNIVFYMLCEGVAFVGLIAMLLRGSPSEEIIVPAIAVALQIVNYPLDFGPSKPGWPLWTNRQRDK